MAADGTHRIADKARRDLLDLRRQVTREVERLIQRLDTERGSSALVRDREALATASRVRLQITAALNAGASMVDVIGMDGIDRAAQVATRDVVLGKGFEPDANAIIARIRNGTLDEVPAAFGDAATKIGEAMRAGLTTGADLGDLIDTVRVAVHTSFARAQSAVDTAIVGTGRAIVLDSRAAAQRETREVIVYEYVGSDDQKTRPFCRAHLGKAFTREALDRLDNGQGLRPTSTFLGGYNCRHSLAPLTISEAQRQGTQVIR